MTSPVFDATAAAPSTDAALLVAWADNRDEAAFAALVERHLPMVHGVARRHLADENAARDVTLIVFSILARKASCLKNVQVLAAWLHRVTAAQSARAIRQLIRDRRRRQSVMEHAVLTSGGRDPLAEALPLLDEALDNLPERDRVLLMLRYREEVSFAEAAVRLGRGEAALRQQAGRAMERLAHALRRNGVALSVATLSGGLGAVLSGGDGTLRAAEVARAALAAAPAVPATSLFLTSLLTMSTFKITVLSGTAALVLTGLPVAWQEIELSRVRAASASSPSATATHAGSPDRSPPPMGAPAAKPAGPRRSGPAAVDMEAISETVAKSMSGLIRETTDRMAGIEARRTARALQLTPEAEAALRTQLAEFYAAEFDNDERSGDQKRENFQHRTRRFIEDHLSATAMPEQLIQWRELRRQREETEIEKVAADALHATARLVDLTPEQQDAIFRRCSEVARELYATNWQNSASFGAAISPVPPEPLEHDTVLLAEVLTPEQLSDWQSQSAAQREFYDSLPRRVLGRIFLVVSGDKLAEAIRSDLPDTLNADPSGAPQ